MSFSEYSFSTAAGVLGDNLAAVSAAASKYGIQSTELDAELILPQACRGEIGFDAGIASSIREKLLECSLNISNLMFRINPVAKDAAIRRRDIDLFMTITAYAKALGANTVCTGSGRAADIPQTHSEESLLMLADSLRPIISRAECRGVNIALEIDAETVLYSPERALCLTKLLKSERLGFAVPLRSFGFSDISLIPEGKLFAVRVTAAEPKESSISDIAGVLNKIASETKNTPEIIIDEIQPKYFSEAVEKICAFQ